MGIVGNRARKHTTKTDSNLQQQNVNKTVHSYRGFCLAHTVCSIGSRLVDGMQQVAGRYVTLAKDEALLGHTPGAPQKPTSLRS
eukprot:1381748-Amphidinium_carterae.1